MGMRDNVDIRQARPEDAAQISALILGVAHYFSSPPAQTVAAWFADSVTPSAIERCVRDPRFNYLVAYSGSTLAGVIALRDATHVHHLFVASAFHRRGIASQLWKRAKTAAGEAGNRDGFAVRSSAYAVSVYERFGFRVAGLRSEKDGIVFVPMQLKL
jgi:ribosomal protein S18 acetylase RimI-like enzyme